MGPEQESQESQVQELPELDRPLSVTCAEKLECSLPSRSGENATLRSTSPKEDMPLPLPSLLPHALPLSWLEDIMSTMSQNSHSSLITSLPRTPRLSSLPSRTSEPVTISAKSENPRN